MPPIRSYAGRATGGWAGSWRSVPGVRRAKLEKVKVPKTEMAPGTHIILSLGCAVACLAGAPASSFGPRRWQSSFKPCLNDNSWAARGSTSPTAAMCGRGGGSPAIDHSLTVGSHCARLGHGVTHWAKPEGRE